jgi:hypothetical protein
MNDWYICLLELENKSIKFGKTQFTSKNLIKQKGSKVIFEKHVDDLASIQNLIIEELEKVAIRNGGKKIFNLRSGIDKNEIIEIVKNIIEKQKNRIYPYINENMFKIHYPYCVIYNDKKFSFQNREYFQLSKDCYCNDPKIETNNIIPYSEFNTFKNYIAGKLYFYDQSNFPMKSEQHFKNYCEKIKDFIDYTKKKNIKEKGILFAKEKLHVKYK